MKIVALGASGCTGRQIVSQGFAAGCAVTAVVRLASVTFLNPKPRVVSGGIFDPAFLPNAVKATDAMISVLGSIDPRPCTQRARRPPSMRCTKGQTSAVTRWIVHPILYQLLGVAYEDMRRMEEMLVASDLTWTVFHPPRLLNWPASGLYRTAIDARLLRPLSLPHADLAAAILASNDDQRLFKRAVQIAE